MIDFNRNNMISVKRNKPRRDTMGSSYEMLVWNQSCAALVIPPFVVTIKTKTGHPWPLTHWVNFSIILGTRNKIAIYKICFSTFYKIQIRNFVNFNLHTLVLNILNTGDPHYMRSFYLRFRIYDIEKWPFFWNLSSNLQ